MFENVKFYRAGKFTSRGEWMHPDIAVPTTEIIAATDGSFGIEEDGIPYTVSAGDVLILDHDRPHRGTFVSKSKVSFYWIHINGFDSRDGGAPAKHFTLRDPHHVSILCRQLLHYATVDAGGEMTDCLARVLLHELKHQSDAEGSGDNVLAARVIEWIRANSHSGVTASDVAGHFGYNEDYISRLLKRYCGCGLKAKIDELRLMFIEHRLLESDMTLSEIAYDAGFHDYKLFLKFFKYHAGMTPGEYRKIFYAIHTNSR